MKGSASVESESLRPPRSKSGEGTKPARCARIVDAVFTQSRPYLSQGIRVLVGSSSKERAGPLTSPIG